MTEQSLIVATVLNLERLIETDTIAAYELVELCRDRDHKLWGQTGETLLLSGLIESDGQPHDEIRRIVLAAIAGDGFDLRLLPTREIVSSLAPVAT